MRFGLLYEAQRPFKGTSVDWNTLYKETLEQCVLHAALRSDPVAGGDEVPPGFAPDQ